MKRSRILVVDGDEALLGRLHRLLKSTYEVVATSQWEHGLDLLSESEFAVVIAGDGLPWLGGVEFLQRAYATAPQSCRILIGSASKAEEIITAVNSARVHHYLKRPLQAAALKDVISHEVELYDDQRRMSVQRSSYEHLLVDHRTGLPNRALLMENAAQALQTTGFLGLVWIDAAALWKRQCSLSPQDFRARQNQFLRLMRQISRNMLRPEDDVAADECQSPRFCIFMAPPRDERVGLLGDALSLQTRVLAYFQRDFGLSHVDIRVGVQFALFDPYVCPTVQVQTMCESARQLTHKKPPQDMRARSQRLHTILAERRIRTLFQPISALADRRVLGYEALSRGPAGDDLENPEHLLDLAGDLGLTFELDRLFRSMALTNAVSLPSDTKIFINTLTSTSHDPDMAVARLSRFLRHLNIAPQRVVFEFSERCNIANHEVWVETLKNCRSLGIGLAIDDVGAGYSGLERIVAVHPDYIKIDRRLVQDVHCLPVKRSVLRSLVHLAGTLSTEVIAEGIETIADLNCLKDLGVNYGQGHLLGRPHHPAPSAWSNLLYLTPAS